MVFSTRQHKQPSHHSGQAAVEVALVLPLLTVFTVAIAQFAIVGRDQLALWQSAREVSRSVALAPDPLLAASQQAGPGRTISVADGAVHVVLTHRTRLSFAGFSFLRRTITLRARVSMALEPPVAFPSDVVGDEFNQRGP